MIKINLDGNPPEHAIDYVYNKLKQGEFKGDIDWSTEICEDLVMEELIGAIVLAKEREEDSISENVKDSRDYTRNIIYPHTEE